SVMAGVYMETFPQLSIRTEWSEKSITYLRRRYHDLVKLVRNLMTFEISGHLTDKRFHYSMYVLSALQRIKEAEQNNNFSHSEAVLTFFKTSPFDYTLKTMYEPIQLLYQSPVTVADVRSANGFCLANTETVLFDVYLQAQGAEPSLKYSNMTYRHLQACETDILE
uniref:PX domain containing 1a n=1 Tax=Sinocyclocheilus grahami TaxID=75366 RepID=A0A672PAF7_SINGR